MAERVVEKEQSARSRSRLFQCEVKVRFFFWSFAKTMTLNAGFPTHLRINHAIRGNLQRKTSIFFLLNFKKCQSQMENSQSFVALFIGAN